MNPFPTQILLATDGSENTTHGTRAAVDIAGGRGSRIHLVHVWHDVRTPHAHAFVKRELRRQGREVLNEEVRRIGEQGGSVTWSYLREGRIFEEVIKLGKEREADLLVVGSRGHRGMRRMLVGSHSEDIVHHARRPVLVVRCGESVWPPGSLRAAISPKMPGKQRSLPRTWGTSSAPGCSCCTPFHSHREHPTRRSQRSWRTGRVSWKTSCNSGHKPGLSQATLRRF